MKIRILDDSIRLRLSQTEVDQSNNEGKVEGITHFPGGRSFRYRLIKSNEEHMNAILTDQGMDVLCPEETIEKWASSNRVGFRDELSLSNGSSLKILVEKDFKCLDPNREEDESDNFENPAAKSGAVC